MFPVRITYTDFAPTQSVERDIHKYARRLQKLFDRIVALDVFVSLPHRHRRLKIFHIKLHLKLPASELVVNRQPQKNYAHSDIHVAIRDAFNALSRQLDGLIGVRRQAGRLHGSGVQKKEHLIRQAQIQARKEGELESVPEEFFLAL